MARHDTLLASMVTTAKASPIGRTEAIRQLQSDALRTELACPVGSQTLVPPPNGNQGLKLHELNALARGPNT